MTTIFETAILGNVIDRLFGPADPLKVTVYRQPQSSRLPFFVIGMVVAYAALKVVK